MQPIKVLISTVLFANIAVAINTQQMADKALVAAKEFTAKIADLKKFQGTYEEKLAKNQEVFDRYFAVYSIAQVVASTRLECKAWKKELKKSGASPEEIANKEKSQVFCSTTYNFDKASPAIQDQFVKTYSTFVAGFFMSSLGKADSVEFGKSVTPISELEAIVRGDALSEGTKYLAEIPYQITEDGNDVRIKDVLAEGTSYIKKAHIENVGGAVALGIKKLGLKNSDFDLELQLGINYMNCMSEHNFKPAYSSSNAKVKEAPECAVMAIEQLKK